MDKTLTLMQVVHYAHNLVHNSEQLVLESFAVRRVPSCARHHHGLIPLLLPGCEEPRSEHLACMHCLTKMHFPLVVAHLGQAWQTNRVDLLEKLDLCVGLFEYFLIGVVYCLAQVPVAGDSTLELVAAHVEL